MSIRIKKHRQHSGLLYKHTELNLLKYGTTLNRGDLVCWEEWEGVPKSGVILDIYPSNVYEPEECVIFTEGATTIIRSKVLKLIDSSSEKEI